MSMQSVGTFEHGSIAGSTIWRAASRPAWLTVGLVLISLVVGCLITGMRFDLWLLAGIFLLYQSIFFFAAVMFLERKMIRLALLAECNLLLSLIAVIVCMTNVVTASSALPLRDALLIDVDSYVGFSWLATVQWFQEQPAISRMLSKAYLTLHKQVPFLLVALAIFRPTYLRQFGGILVFDPTVDDYYFPIYAGARWISPLRIAGSGFPRYPSNNCLGSSRAV
jgi:PAP2 superfamily